MKRSAGLVTLACASLIAGEALAADMPVKAPMAAPVPAAYSWTGCYVGGNAGAILGADRINLAPAGDYLTLVPDVDRALAAHSYSPNTTAGTAGLEAGCNKQWDRFVLGIESDINWSGLDESISASYPIVIFGPNQFWGPHNENVNKQLSWFSTVRARGGVAYDRFFFFLTGGLAIAKVNSNLDYLTTDIFAVHFVGSSSQTRVGATVGAGLEYALTNNWTVKAEYLYLDFGTLSYTSAMISPAPPPNFAWGTEIHLRENVVRAGVNFKFN
jgi:outer membrane immunogenic protein